MNYKEALAWLYGTQLFGIKLGLESIRRLLGALNLPEPRHKIIHVAGTNGKGSVCAMIDSILRAQGFRTGLFTSPHLVTFRERIQVDGKMISEEETALGLTTIRELITSWEPHPTFFEIVTALALLHFRERRAEFVVLETGMGGRLDATNAMQPIVSVITPIDFDHEKWLGHSLTSIAREKAGIIKPKIPVVSAPQHPEAEEVICARATECGAPFRFVRQNFRGEIALSGEHQRQNASLAIAVLRAAQIETSEDAIARGLHSVTWPARFQRWDERTVIDGAHNPAGARVLAETWQQTFPGKKATLILAALVDKDLPQICAALAPIADFILLPKIRSARAVEPDTLAELLASLPCSISPSIDAALATARARPNPILITGSLHFAGEVLAHLQGVPAAYEECLQ